jgi:hypothetical protein
MLFRMLDGDRPYLGSFLSRIGNTADQEQNHSDNQQDKPQAESAHRCPPFPSQSNVNSGTEEKGDTSRPEIHCVLMIRFPFPCYLSGGDFNQPEPSKHTPYILE